MKKRVILTARPPPSQTGDTAHPIADAPLTKRKQRVVKLQHSVRSPIQEREFCARMMPLSHRSGAQPGNRPLPGKGNTNHLLIMTLRVSLKQLKQRRRTKSYFDVSKTQRLHGGSSVIMLISAAIRPSRGGGILRLSAFFLGGPTRSDPHCVDRILHL